MFLERDKAERTHGVRKPIRGTGLSRASALDLSRNLEAKAVLSTVLGPGANDSARQRQW